MLPVDHRRFRMCHERWLRGRFEEREASRQMWEEFDQTTPLSEPQTPEEDKEVRLEEREPTPLATER
jgi:hypothetical protein